MDLKEFKRLYKKFNSKKLDKDVWDAKEYSDYIDSTHKDAAISDWYLKQRIKKSKIKVGRHCCTKMTFYLTYDKPTKQINPDAIIRFWKKSKIYGIPVHDGGSSIIVVGFCPWCGTKLTNKI